MAYINKPKSDILRRSSMMDEIFETLYVNHGYEFNEFEDAGENNKRITFLYKKNRMSNESFLNSLENSFHFRKVFVNSLRKCSKHMPSGFFLEMPPICTDTLNDSFEMVLMINDDPFKEANHEKFEQYFNEEDEKTLVTEFLSISKNSMLVSPSPYSHAMKKKWNSENGDLKETVNYKTAAHIKSFITAAPEEVIDAFFQQVAKTALDQVENKKKIWISTSGKDVPWLHARISLKGPIYYNHKDYKENYNPDPDDAEEQEQEEPEDKWDDT